MQAGRGQPTDYPHKLPKSEVVVNTTDVGRAVSLGADGKRQDGAADMLPQYEDKDVDTTPLRDPDDTLTWASTRSVRGKGAGTGQGRWRRPTHRVPRCSRTASPFIPSTGGAVSGSLPKKAA